MRDGALAEPPALIQLESNGRIKQPLPQWREGDIATLTPHVGCMCNDVEETGRCFVDLYLSVSYEDRDERLDQMIPRNPNLYDFTKDSTNRESDNRDDD